jgi:chromosome segregation ATPase
MPMLSRVPFRPALLTCALSLALAPLGLSAQTAAKKPAAAAVPAAGGNKTLSGGAGNGKLMSFKELEVCLKEQQDLNVRAPELQRQREAMDVERKRVVADAEALKADSALVSAIGEKIKAYNARVKEQGEKVQSWRDRQAAFESNDRTGPAVERTRKELERDRDLLQKNQTALDAENASLNEERGKVATGYSERVAAQEKAANDWNARSRTLDAASQTYEDDRLAWRGRCADRPYREDDEKLIRREMEKAK